MQATSPLRRYLDLVVHQQLRAFLRGEPLLDEQAILVRIGSVDDVVRGTRRVERLARHHWTLVFLLQNPDWTGDAIVLETTAVATMSSCPTWTWKPTSICARKRAAGQRAARPCPGSAPALSGEPLRRPSPTLTDQLPDVECSWSNLIMNLMRFDDKVVLVTGRLAWHRPRRRRSSSPPRARVIVH